MNNNNNGDEDEDDADEQQQVEQQRAEAEAAAVAETQKEERMELISVVLERKKKVPKRTRNKIDKLVEKFLQDLEDDIHEMLCCNNDDPDDYCGLDSSRDTVAEVETAIRLFPDVLSRHSQRNFYDNDDPVERVVYYLHPIQCLSSNLLRISLMTCSFIPVLARLAIEFGTFERHLRGGLLNQNFKWVTVLEDLVYGMGGGSQEHKKLADNTCLELMKELKESGLLVKEDILRYELLRKSFVQDYSHFAKFRFLVEWDLAALMQPNHHKHVILHFAATSIQAFRVVFEAGIRYFPKKKGISILFSKDEDDDTPFQDACNNHGREKVVKIIEDTLTYYHSDTPLNIADALLSAAIDDSIHLDCVYFLLRRQPDVLQKMLSAKAETAEATVTAEGNEDNNSKVIRKRKRNL